MSAHSKLSLAAAILLPMLAWADEPRPAPKAAVERGRYLATIGSCNDCHTPWKLDPEIGLPLPDMSRMLSGHPEGAPDPASDHKGGDMAVIGPTFTAFRFPFGVTYAANLTPDKETGLGNWTEEMFISALRKGKHMGGEGRTIMPPMPWPLIGQMSDDDLKAVFAFLRTLPPIKNEVAQHKVPDAVVEELTMKNAKLAKRIGKARQPAAAVPTRAVERR
jgi:mono/diheme cytochrome c family protein